MQGGGGRAEQAFTMAGILLSLTIIGVVAAITLPSLTGNINERTWNTQRKALYARMSQAIALMPALNGYGTLIEGNESTSAVDTAAETFVTAGLSKVLKINNICDSEHLSDCGIPAKITTLNNDVISNFNTSPYNTLVGFNEMFNGRSGEFSYSQLDTKAAAFETKNSESIVVYYNPNCVADMGENFRHYTQPKMCANFVYDLNGNKGPNTVGKDIGFISVLYPSDSVIVAPMPLSKNAGSSIQQINAGVNCVAQNRDSRVPNRDELASMFYNRKLLGIYNGYYWSSSVISAGSYGDAWFQKFEVGYRAPLIKVNTTSVRCIKR